MSGPELKIAYLREYPSEKSDIRFTLKVEKSNGDTFCKEIIGFARTAEILAVLKRNIQERIVELNNSTEATDEIENISYKLPTSPEEVEVLFLSQGKTYSEDIILEDFNKLDDGNKSIQVLGQTFSICLNAPLIRQLTLPYGICANFPIRPAKFLAQNCERDDTKFFWFKSLDKEVWNKVGETFQYDVQESDVDHFLKVCCIPYSDNMVKGPSVEAISESKVEVMPEFPSRCPFQDRHAMTNEKLEGRKFRVASYNILADKYVGVDRFSYCPPNILCIHYRKQLIIKELTGYNADVICLQEVDSSHYQDYYRKQFKKNGFKSFFNKKGNCMPEGLVCAFNEKRFKHLETKQFVLKNADEKFGQYKDIFKVLNLNEDLKTKFMQQQTSLQTTILEEKKTKNIVIVGNTHLYYHPEANDVRLMQAFMVTTRLRSIKNGIMKKHNTKKVSVILCGDFNSDSADSLYDFMTKGQIDPRHEDCLKINPFGRATIYHTLRLGCASGTPKYTNYTKDYKGCLDYIFIETLNISLTRRIPVPTEQELEQYEGLPNLFYPSDHVALVVDLEFKL